MSVDVMIDGAWVSSVAHVGEVKFSDRWGDGPCGPDSLSFTVSVDPGDDSSWLRLGSKVEGFIDGVKVFGGRLSEMGRGFPRTIHARSWARLAADFDALDSALAPTTNTDTAVAQAIVRGLPWSTSTGVFDNTSFGDDTTASTNRLDALLNAWSTAKGKRWGVDAEGRPFARADSTTVSWFLDASGLDIGVASDGLFTRVHARYVSAVSGTPPEPSGWSTVAVDDAAGQALYGVMEYAMDLTGLGLLTSTQATDYATAQLNLLTVPQWLSRVAATDQNLYTPGGLPAHLPSLRAGQVVELFNVPNNLGGLRNEMNQRVVLGETEHDADNPGEVVIAPVGLAVRNLLDALTAAKRAADAAARTELAA